MPGWTTDAAVGASALEPFPGEDGSEWELVTRSKIAAATAARTLFGAQIFLVKKEGAPDEYVLRDNFDHDGAVARVAEFNGYCGSELFHKRPCS